MVLDENLDFPMVWLAFPAIFGALGITAYQHKKGDSPVFLAGKVILAFGCGFFGGRAIGAYSGFDRFVSSFAGAGLMPVLLSVGESYVRSKAGVKSNDAGESDVK